MLPYHLRFCIKRICSRNILTSKYVTRITAKKKYTRQISTLNKNISQMFTMKNLCRNCYIHCKSISTSSITLCSNNDVPDYLKKIVNKVLVRQDDSVEDLEEFDNCMEDELIDALSSRAVSFEEMESSFVVSCPACGQSNKSHDMFIDKNSGYCVCPWCYLDGNWEDIVKMLDSKEDTLTEQQLNDYFYGLKPIDDSHSDILSSSPFQDMEIKHLQNLEAKISEDNSRMIFPLYGEQNITVGFAAVSLQQNSSEVIYRVLEGQSAIFSGLQMPKTKKVRVVVVSNLFDALRLSKCKIFGVVLVSDPKEEMLHWIFQSFKNVVLWCDPFDISQHMLQYLSKNKNNINSYAVRCTSNIGAITSLSDNKISQLIIDALPLSFDCCITRGDIENAICERIRKKDEKFGVKWTRFTELNHLLLGHRRGELTIFSGQTGSGKTTLMSEYSLDLCSQGVPTLWGSFEIAVPRLFEIMLQQYSGKPLAENCSSAMKLIDQFFEEMPMHFLNIHGQQPLKNVIDKMTEIVLTNRVHHVVIDNLQFMLGLHGAGDWWLEQDRSVGAFRQFATAYNCHVTLIVHPRKLPPGENLNLHSISGGARVTQEADNVMILHVKRNKDGSSDTSAPKTLQVVKNRYGGTLGEMRLRFHKESLTMSSCFRSKHEKQTEISLQDKNTFDFKDISTLFIER